MNKKITNLFKYAFFLGLGIFLVWWSLHQIPDEEWGKFKKALYTAHYYLLIPVFIILTSAHFVRALRWRLLMEPMGYLPSLPNTFFSVMVGYLANMAVPRLGEVLKCTILAKYEKVPAEKIVGTIVAERAFDVVCLGLIFVLATIFQFDVVVAGYHHLRDMMTMNHNAATSPNKKIFYYAILAIVIIAFILMLVVGEFKVILRGIKKILLGVAEGLLSARKLKHKWLFFIYTILIWVFYLISTWIGLYATDGTGMGIKETIACLAFASIGMIVTPGGIGAYAILLAKVLEENGVDYTLGIANGTLQWFAQTIIVVSVGFTCLMLLPWYNKRKSGEIL